MKQDNKAHTTPQSRHDGDATKNEEGKKKTDGGTLSFFLSNTGTDTAAASSGRLFASCSVYALAAPSLTRKLPEDIALSLRPCCCCCCCVDALRAIYIYIYRLVLRALSIFDSIYECFSSPCREYIRMSLTMCVIGSGLGVCAADRRRVALRAPHRPTNREIGCIDRAGDTNCLLV